MVEKAKKIWLDGKFVDWDDANVHILTHTLHYGLGIFEGMRRRPLGSVPVAGTRGTFFRFRPFHADEDSLQPGRNYSGYFGHPPNQ